MSNTLRRRAVCLTAAACLAVSGCAAPQHADGSAHETANFSFELPHGLTMQSKPESVLWDYTACDDTYGYTISFHDVDMGYQPAEFLQNDFREGEANWETGEAGILQYSGWTVDTDDGFLLRYAAGTEGRLLHIEGKIPKKKKRRAKKQIMQIIGSASYIGLPPGAGSITKDGMTVDYSDFWAPSTGFAANDYIITLHPAKPVDDALSFSLTRTDDPQCSPEESARNIIAFAEEHMPGHYEVAEVLQQEFLGREAWTAREIYAGSGMRLYQDTVTFMENGSLYMANLLYSEDSREIMEQALRGITLQTD